MSSDGPTAHHAGGTELMRALAASSIAAGRPLDWYEELYAAAEAGIVAVPWDHGVPTPLLVDWLDKRLGPDEAAGKAVVVGCAYGDDAELVASRGFDTTAFDVSASAVVAAQRRHPDSDVHYVRADLLDLPARWRRRFDLVIESTTVQSIAPRFHAPAAAAIASLCADGGVVVVVARKATGHESPGPPWLLTEDEIGQFEVDGVRLELLETMRDAGGERWRAELRRCTPGSPEPDGGQTASSSSLP